MAYTINIDGESVSKEELDLLRTKQAILEKLHVRFSEMPNPPAWYGAPNGATETQPIQRN